MQYMLIFFETADDFARRQGPEAEAHWGGWMTYVQRLRASGSVVSGHGLQSPGTATTVRLRDGRRMVQDGPFADTKEQLAGYFVIDVPDLDAALDWAAQAPSAVTSGVEVRPVLPPPPGN